MIWENIHKSAQHDATARAILVYGSERVAKRFSKRFLVKNGCWEFCGNKRGSYSAYRGIGLKSAKDGLRFTALAHRVSWLLHGGDFNRGMVIDHKCRNRSCVNPAHLREVTHQFNTLIGESIQAMNAKKTHCKRGHEFTPENTRTSGRSRSCRACQREHMRKWREKQ